MDPAQETTHCRHSNCDSSAHMGVSDWQENSKATEELCDTQTVPHKDN